MIGVIKMLALEMSIYFQGQFGPSSTTLHQISTETFRLMKMVASTYQRFHLVLLCLLPCTIQSMVLSTMVLSHSMLSKVLQATFSKSWVTSLKTTVICFLLLRVKVPWKVGSRHLISTTTGSCTSTK